MQQIWLAFALISSIVSSRQPFAVQFVKEVSGRAVTICLDGRKVETTFAGKLGFRDRYHEWTSVCAAVRKPIVTGQYTAFRARNSTSVGKNIAKAGNIVAHCFDAARTPDQCAGLQVAVWEALEDGGVRPNFLGGRFQVKANEAILANAAMYYAAIVEEKSATYLESANGKSQSQLSTGGIKPTPPKPPVDK